MFQGPGSLYRHVLPGRAAATPWSIQAAATAAAFRVDIETAPLAEFLPPRFSGVSLDLIPVVLLARWQHRARSSPSQLRRQTPS